MEKLMTELRPGEGYRRCLHKAVQKAGVLLAGDRHAIDTDEVHAVKSILYAAIERAWMESERLLGVQRMLRELLMLTAVRADAGPEDREQARRILARLEGFDQELRSRGSHGVPV